MPANPLVRLLRRAGLPPQLLLLLVADMLTVLGTALGIFALRMLCGDFTDAPAYRVLLALLFLAPLFGVSLGLYRSIALPPHRELKALFGMTSMVYALALLILFLTKSGDIFSRMVLLGSWGATLLLLPVVRSFCRRRFSRRWWWGCPLVILGRSRAARDLWHWLRRHPENGLKPMQILALPDDTQSFTALLQRVQARHPNAVGDQKNAELVRLANQHFRQLLVVPQVHKVFRRYWVTPCDLGAMTGLLLSQNLCDTRRLHIKRCIDLVLCLLALPLILPLGLLLALAIRLDSPGPIFYRQERIGQHGRRLRIFKFRTMQANADSVLQEWLSREPALRQEWERDFKLKDDPRITRVGRFLRKTSLDELPQLINVITGGMSLVGPRPIVPNEIGKYGHVYESYCRVKPGITGLWQVSGRNDTSYAERVDYDNYYISNWSVWMDIWILGKTVPVVLTGYGAY
ncbi:MAG: undecaprenyl-phosphate galactose phosphotransferase WbaP [Desulfovibrionaceae bacterium]|nr:undecaprenyl-phosphate galactose phosphotransferase WbaP [Desulfovibrionaceae bacterium]